MANLHFTTYTLKYNRLAWLTIDWRSAEHWSRGGRMRTYVDDDDLDINAYNVTALTIDMPPGECMIIPLAVALSVTINDQILNTVP